MAVTVALHPEFRTLNGGANRLRMKPNSITQEREAVIQISLNGQSTDAAGNIPVDCSVVRGFKKVYDLNITINGFENGLVKPIIDADFCSKTVSMCNLPG